MSGVEIFQIWLMAFFTLALFSFLYKDNPVYKFAEHIFAGLSAGYYVGLIWDTVIVQQLWQPMIGGHWWLFIPGILGFLMFARFTTKYSWVSRSPLAFVMAVTAGIFLVSQLHGIVLKQVQSTMVPRFESTELVARGLKNHSNVFEIVDSVSAGVGPVTADDITVSRGQVSRLGSDSLVIATTFDDAEEAVASDFAMSVRLREPTDRKKILLASDVADTLPGVSFRQVSGSTWEAQYVFRPDSTYAVGAYDISVEIVHKNVKIMLTALILLGVISTLIYFYFSKEHTGALGVTARVGIWFIMIAFGAHFGYTVMGRVSLLIGRVQFLAEDWIGTFPHIF